MAAGKTHDINRPGMYELVQAFGQDQMDTALQDLQGMTGLTEQDLPGRMPVIFFATMPESYDDGFQEPPEVCCKRGEQSAPISVAVCSRHADRVLSCLSGCVLSGCVCARQWPTAFSVYSSLRLERGPNLTVSLWCIAEEYSARPTRTPGGPQNPT